MKYAILLYSGFTQPASLNTGLGQLYSRLCETHYDRRRSLVLSRTWKSQHDQDAQLVCDYGAEWVYVVGYSYGAGHGIKQFAKQMAKRGRDIDVGFFVDPVPRFKLMKPISLTRWGTFEIPQNVIVAHGYRQVNASPYGRMLDRTGHSGEDYVFGTTQNLVKYGQSREILRQFAFGHDSMDNRKFIHRDIEMKIRKHCGTKALTPSSEGV